MRKFFVLILFFSIATVRGEELCMLWQTGLTCWQQQAAQDCGSVIANPDQTFPFPPYVCQNSTYYEYGANANDTYDEIVWDTPQPGDNPGPDDVVAWRWDLDADFVDHHCYSEGDCSAEVDPFWQQNNPNATPTISNYVCIKTVGYEDWLMLDTMDMTPDLENPPGNCELDENYYW